MNKSSSTTHRRRLAAAGLSAAASLLVWSPGAQALDYAPLDQPGPALSVPAAQLKASLSCEPSVRNAKVEPVLLSPGTAATPVENFSWNWEPALDKLGIPWCAYTAPNNTLDRIDVSGEYLVYAIRTMYRLAGRRIAILGHSQGGMSPRWALRYWPDTRTMVDDLVGVEPTNHGTTVVTAPECEQLGCVAADWQQTSTSNFVQALNSGTETFPGISYTNVYSTHDEIATPDTGPTACTSCLHIGAGEIANVELQSICPLDLAEHGIAGTTDPVAYALGIDAITHPGPADPARVPSSVCSQLLMPGVLTPQSASQGLAPLGGATTTLGIFPGPQAGALSKAPLLHADPQLPCYVHATCTPTIRLKIKATPAKATLHHNTTIRLTVTVTIDQITSPVPNATIWIGHGQHLQTDQHGHARITLRFGRAGHRKATATAPEYLNGSTTITVTPTRRR